MGWFRAMGRDRPWLQGLVIAVSGVVLAVSGCFGFIATLDLGGGPVPAYAEVLNPVLAIVFGIGALAVLVGVVWLIVGVILRLSRKPAPPGPQSPPEPPPSDGA